MNMMSKYTLKFKQKQLEEEFVKQRQNTINIPVFKTGLTCIFFVASYKITQIILDGKLNLIPVLIICQLYSIISVLLLKFKIHKVNYQLIILSYLFIANEYLLAEEISKEALGLYLSNYTYCNIIIILILEYTEAVFVIITTILFKLIYTIIIDSQRSYTIYSSSLIAMIFLCFFSYKINEQSRLSFLLSQQDYMWESIFPKIIEKPYLILQFNEEKIEFTLKSSHHLFFECVDNKQLKNFLREWKHQSQSLESILFQSYKKFNQVQSYAEYLEIQNSKKQKLQVKFAVFPATSNNIFLSIEQKLRKNNHIIKQIQKIQICQQKIIYNLVNNVYSTIKTALANQKFLKLIYLRNKCYLQSLNLNIRNSNLDDMFSPENLQEIQELFDYKKIKISCEQKIGENQLHQIVPSIYFKRLLFEICKTAFKNSTIIIIFGNITSINYYGNIAKIEKNQALNSFWNMLVENYQKEDYFITLFLHKDPYLKFESKGRLF